MVTLSNGCYFIWKAFCWFLAFPGFHFLLQGIFENPETTEMFQKFIFRSVKSIYLIWSTFLRILYVQDKTLMVLLKVIRALTIEAWNWLFLLLKPKWYADTQCATPALSAGAGRDRASYEIFKKGELDRTLIFRGGLVRKRGWPSWGGRLQFLCQK